MSFARLKGKRLALSLQIEPSLSQLSTEDISQERRGETAVMQAISPFACNFLDGVNVLSFFSLNTVPYR